MVGNGRDERIIQAIGRDTFWFIIIDLRYRSWKRKSIVTAGKTWLENLFPKPMFNLV
jgi:hypothetical protein